MVFNDGVLFAVLAIWVLVLTGWVVYRELQLRRFLGSAKEGDIRHLLDILIRDLAGTNEALDNVKQAIVQIQKKDVSHIQKIGLVRFNPFRDAGGNQSFALAILSDENTGVVLTGLHARETTRIYIKDLVKGVCRSELSKEEKEVIEMAIGKGRKSGDN